MDDISREPLPEVQRLEGGGRKGPAEVVRLDESHVDENGGGRIGGTDSADSGAAEATARTFETARLAPPVPLRLAPFAMPEEDAEPEVAEPEVAESEAAESEAVESEVVESEVVGAEAATEDAEAADSDEPELARSVPSVDELVADDDEEPALEAEPAMGLDELEDVSGDDAPPLTDPVELSRVLLAVLLSSREPMKRIRLAEICNSTQQLITEALDVLEGELRGRGFPLELMHSEDAVRLMTAPAVFPYLERLRKSKKAEKLSPAALETLAVIAYRQPAIRAEIEAIRGVKVGPMLRSLLEHKLVKVVGRADVPGRPLQYGTTQHFLDRFGLNSLKDLPSVQEFRSLG